MVKVSKFYSKISKKTRVSTLTTPIRHGIGYPSQSNYGGVGGGEDIQIRKEKVNLFADDMTLHREKSQRLHQKTSLLELMNKFSTAAGYEINLQKSDAFLHTNNEICKKERGKNTFILTSETIKYFGINVNQEGKRYIRQKLKDFDERN